MIQAALARQLPIFTLLFVSASVSEEIVHLLTSDAVFVSIYSEDELRDVVVGARDFITTFRKQHLVCVDPGDIGYLSPGRVYFFAFEGDPAACIRMAATRIATVEKEITGAYVMCGSSNPSSAEFDAVQAGLSAVLPPTTAKIAQMRVDEKPFRLTLLLCVGTARTPQLLESIPEELDYFDLPDFLRKTADEISE